MGIAAQLQLESETEECQRLARFFLDIGLPVHLGHLGLSPGDRESIDAVAQAALAFPFIGNMPGEVDESDLGAALLAADHLGRQLADRYGDAAYRALH